MIEKIVIILSFLIYSCSHQEKNKLNEIVVLSEPVKEITRLSEIASDISYIPLQTNDSSLMGHIFSLKATGNFFYFRTLDKIYCFSDQGNFLFKLDKKGRGPGEYNFIHDFDITADNKILAVLNRSEVLLYNISNNGLHFRNKITCSESADKINFINLNYDILVQYDNSTGQKMLSKELLNINGDKLKAWPNAMKFALKDGIMVYSDCENISYLNNNNLFVKEKMNDTIFCLNSSNILEPFLVFNTGDKRLTPEARANGAYYSEHTGDYFTIQRVFGSERFIYFKFLFNKKMNSYRSVYDISNSERYSISDKALLKDDLAGGPAFDPQYSRDGFFYAWLDALKFRSFLKSEEFEHSVVSNPQKKAELKKLAGSLLETDNPVLVKVKIR
jgi:hypothetical protein